MSWSGNAGYVDLKIKELTQQFLKRKPVAALDDLGPCPSCRGGGGAFVAFQVAESPLTVMAAAAVPDAMYLNKDGSSKKPPPGMDVFAEMAWKKRQKAKTAEKGGGGGGGGAAAVVASAPAAAEADAAAEEEQQRADAELARRLKAELNVAEPAPPAPPRPAQGGGRAVAAAGIHTREEQIAASFSEFQLAEAHQMLFSSCKIWDSGQAELKRRCAAAIRMLVSGRGGQDHHEN